MVSKTRKFVKTKMMMCSDGVQRMITCYGELVEHDFIFGVMTVPVAIKGKSTNNEVAGLDAYASVFTPALNSAPTRTKEFNMGFAICNPEDDFQESIAIDICKRRFKKPITTQNGRFLTPDMCQAILENEVQFVANHVERYLPKA